MATFQYPYRSELVQDAKEHEAIVQQWQVPGLDLQATIHGLNGTILEIGGPTEGGYFFLDDILLNSPVTITNIKADGLPFAPNKKELNKHIEQLVDGRHLPYPDNSLAVVLAAHLPLVDDTSYDFAKLEEEEDKALFQAISEVEAGEKRLAEIGIINDAVLAISQRLAIAHEVYRKLQPGGLYITDATPDQVKALQVLGFTKLAEINIYSVDPALAGAEPYYELVFQK